MSAGPVVRRSSHAGLAAEAAVLDEPVHVDRLVRLDRQHGLGEHVQRYGPPPAATRDLLDRLQAAGLTGRGGAHFPVAAKWRSVLAAGGTQTVVANGAESEPASAKDQVLLALRPHLVLDGLALAVTVLGAAEGVLWMHEGSAALPAVAAAVRERFTAGWGRPPLRIVTAPASYLSGESGAIRSALAGGPLLPAPSGRGRRPGATVVQNVETLARIALIARGVPAAADAALATVLDEGQRSVVEAAPGESAAHLVLRARGYGGRPPQAVLVGGYAGTWTSWSQAHDHAMAGPDRWAGSGAGLVAVLPYGACGIAETTAVLDYLAGSSAGQCGPCLFGLPSVADLADRLARGRARRSDLRRLLRESGDIDGRGGCSHPDGAVRMLRSALTTFAADVVHHLDHGRCGAGGDARVLPVPGRR